MDNRIHFIAGLPRSGSTLLSAILRQNPTLQAAMTSPVGSLYAALETAMSRRNETAVFLSAVQRKEILRGVFSGYYAGAAPGTVVFDTNRLWCARMAAIAELFPKARVVCCVRPVSWIINSIERQIARNKFELSALFNYTAATTVYSRTNSVASSEGMVGFSLDALREACFGPYADRLILLDYETLTRAPAEAMDALYDLLELPRFVHDFDDVNYSAEVFDSALGSPGLHDVHGKVEWRPRESVLPPDLFARFVNDSFWLAPEPRLARIPKILRQEWPA